MILSIKEQEQLADQWLHFRLENILPDLMKREGIDMWIVMGREYNEDPVLLTLLPSRMKTASRLTCLIFSMDRDNQLLCLSAARSNPYMNEFYQNVLNAGKEDQWACIRRLVEEKNPTRIGVNISDDFALADGLTQTLHYELTEALGPVYSDRLVSAEKLCIGWLERRSQPELLTYPDICSIADSIISEAFSANVIKPGITTTDDVEWWIKQKINALGLTAWFSPDVDLQRQGAADTRISGSVILPGDLLHCDVGVQYLGLCTDTQRLAYVLKPGEQAAPDGIKAAIKTCNRLQDILAKHFITGMSGNEILSAALKASEYENIKAMIYTHPIGFHGHAAGPTIGRYDAQQGVPVTGDYPLYSDTCYALELNCTQEVPEWDSQQTAIYLEETISYTDCGVSYLGKRQTEPILI